MKLWPLPWFSKRVESPTRYWKISGALYRRLSPADLEPIDDSWKLPAQYAEFRRSVQDPKQ